MIIEDYSLLHDYSLIIDISMGRRRRRRRRRIGTYIEQRPQGGLVPLCLVVVVFGGLYYEILIQGIGVLLVGKLLVSLG